MAGDQSVSGDLLRRRAYLTRSCATLVLLCWCTMLDAQPGANTPAFEVASVTPSKPGTRMDIVVTLERLTMRSVSVRNCVQWAYDLRPFELPGEDHAADRFDILAKAEGPVPDKELRAMLRTLLAAEFN